jgi:hypothetical protein
MHKPAKYGAKIQKFSISKIHNHISFPLKSRQPRLW